MLARQFAIRGLVLLAFAALASPAFCQLAPPDVLEPVNVPATVLSTVEDRGKALYLLEQARHNYRSATGGHPFTLKASFTATGQTEFEGDGKFEETVNGSHWRMTAQLGASNTVRLASGTRMYGNSATEPIPLRVQLVWAAIFYPVPVASRQGTLRMASVIYKGDPLTCILISGSVPRAPATRYYQEVEECVDPESHLLRVWSEKPGIYAEYDYTNAINFHGNVMARQISITEAGIPAVLIHIDSLEDPTEAENAALKATPALVDSFAASAPNTFPLRIPAPQGNSWEARVIVHASIGANDGNVIEAEALQNSDPQLTQAALEAVKSQHFPPTGMQREAFINVMFNLPAK